MRPASRLALVVLTALAAGLSVVPGSALAAAGTISTYAGTGVSGAGGDGGAATSATFNSPLGLATAPDGTLYIADYAVHRVRKITPGGTVNTFAGTGIAGGTGDGGPAVNARLNQPGDVAIDSQGNVYIADASNHQIRKVSTAGVITRFAGSTQGSSGDGGPATSAQLNYPYGVAVDSADNVYIAEYATNKVRRVTPGGTITTVAGTSVAGSTGDGGAATSATLNGPVDVAVDASGNIYISEYDGNRIRKVNASGTISRFAGTGIASTTGDGGPATSATVNAPWGLSVSSAGDIHIAELGGHVIRKVSPLGAISRVAGTSGSAGFSGDGGAATSAQLNSPGAAVAGPTGDAFISDLGNHRIRRIEAVQPPAEPRLSALSPTSPANGNTVSVAGTAATGTTVKLYSNSTCTSSMLASGTAAAFASPGLSVSVADNSTTTIYATATNSAGPSACSATSLTYVEDSAAPGAPTISAAPASPGYARNPAWSFTGAEGGGTYQCRLDRSGSTQVYDWTTCTSGFSFDLTARPDDTYTFSVRQRDAASNNGTAATDEYVLDTSPPAAPVIAPGTPTQGKVDPSWSFSGEAGATFECRVDRGVTEVYNWYACVSGDPVSLAGKPDGTYTFAVRARDMADNGGTASSATYRYDTTAPSAPTIGGPPSPGSSHQPEWTLSSEDGATFECRLDDSGGQVYGWAACTSPHQYALGGKPDGTYTLSARATDAVGNTGPVATSSYTLDSSLPAAPTITVAATSPGKGRSPSWTYSSTETGVSFRCQLEDANGVVSAWAPCDSSTTHDYDLTGLADGAYKFSVRARNALGTDGAPDSVTYVLDTQAPTSLTVTPSTTPTADPHPSWAIASEANATFECRLVRDGSQVHDWTGCGTPPYAPDLTNEADGSYVLSVRATDQALNTGSPVDSTAWVLDRSRPGLATIDSSPPPAGSDANPSWGISIGFAGTMECRLTSGAATIDNWATCGPTKSYSLTSDGSYTFAVRAVNPLGTPGDPVTGTYTFDTAAPAAPTIGTGPASVSAGRSPEWSFSGEGGATFQCRLVRGSTEVSAWATCTSPARFELAGQDDGVYTFYVRARDAALNLGGASTGGFELDTTAPAEPGFSATPTSPGSTRLPSWSWNVSGAAGSECRVERGGDVLSDWSACTTPYVHDLGGQPDGSYTLRVRGVDSAGNRGPAAGSAYELDTQPGAMSIASGPDPVTKAVDASFSFSGEAGASYTCRLSRGGETVSDWGTCANPHSVDLSGAPDGDYTLTARAADAAGNNSPEVKWAFTLDRQPPAPAEVDSTPAPRSRDRTPTWTFTADAGTHQECRVVRSTEEISGWAACVSPLKVDLRDQQDGSYSLYVRAVDAAGNEAAPTKTTYRLDTTEPDAPDITSDPGRSGTDRTPTWSFRAEAQAVTECRLKEPGETPTWKACQSPKTFDLDAKPLGAYGFAVRATDAAGNTGEAASRDYELNKPAPSGGGGSTGGGDSGGGGSAGDSPAATDPGSPAPAAGPAAPAATPPAAAPATPSEDDAGNKQKGEPGTAGAGAGGAGGRGAPAGAPGSGAGTTPGPGGAPGAGGAGGDGSGGDGGKKKDTKVPDVLGKPLAAVGAAGEMIAKNPDKTVFPFSLILVVVGFMLLQGRIDRNDPKLALAPVFADPDLEFRPPRDARAALETP